jgi:hypothetical protein
MGIETAIIGSALLGTTASNIYSGKKAADAQKDAAKQASNTQLEMFYQNREDLDPYRQIGGNALNVLSSMYTGKTYDNETGELVEGEGPDYSSFYESPDYKFAYDQGMKAVEQNMAKRGFGSANDSGATMKALARFGSGLASQNYANYKNSLQSLAGIGQSSTNTVANLGTQVANNVAANQKLAGDARASSYLNTGAAINNLIGGTQQLAMMGV